jgi:pyrroloquinoline quinone biosynthesis protein D
MSTLKDKPRPSHPALAWREVGGEVVLVDPTQADTIVRVFNDVAGLIWMRLDGQHDLATIASQLAVEFDAPESDIQADVLAFVDELAGKGVLIL